MARNWSIYRMKDKFLKKYQVLTSQNNKRQKQKANTTSE